MSCSISSTAMPRSAMPRMISPSRVHLGRRQAGGRLVEQDQARLAGERARDLEQAALAEGKRGRRRHRASSPRPTNSISSSRPLAARASSRARPAPSTIDQRRAPKRVCAPTSTLSITGMPANGRLCWKVRITPRAAISCGGRPRIGSPAKRTSPAVAGNAPAMRLKVVRLAGAVRPDHAEDLAFVRRRSRARRTAVRPPKRLVSSRTSSVAFIGRAKRSQMPIRPRGSSRIASDHQHAEDQRMVVPDERREPERQQEEQHRADHRARVAAGAADDHHEEQQEHVLDAEDRRVDGVVDEGVDHAGDARERAGQREGDDLGARDIDAHRRRGFRVVAHRAAGAAEPGAVEARRAARRSPTSSDAITAVYQGPRMRDAEDFGQPVVRDAAGAAGERAALVQHDDEELRRAPAWRARGRSPSSRVDGIATASANSTQSAMPQHERERQRQVQPGKARITTE